MEYELSLDPKTICRICLAEHPSLKTIFCNEIVNGSILPFPTVFECVMGFKVHPDDGFPAKLCPVCRQTTNESYILKQKFKANRLLSSGILNIQLNDDRQEEIAKKVYVSAATQTVVHQTPAECQSTQTDAEPAVVPKVHRTQAVQTAVRRTESAHTQTDTQTEPKSDTPLRDPAAPVVKIETLPCTAVTIQLERTKTVPSNCTVLQLNQVELVQNAEFVNINTSLDQNIAIEPMDSTPIILPIQAANDSESHTIEFLYGEPAIITTTGDDNNDGDPLVEYLIEEFPEPAATVVAQPDEEEVDDEESLRNEYMLGSVDYIMDSDDEQSTQSTQSVELPTARKRQATTPKQSANKNRKISNLTCSLCLYNAKSYADLGTHVLAHKQSLPALLNSIYYFRCADCNAVYLQPEDVDKHRGAGGSCQRWVAGGSDGDGGCTDYQVLDDEWLTGDIGCDGELDLDSPKVVDVHNRLCSGVRIANDQIQCDRCELLVCPSAKELLKHYNTVHYDKASSGDQATDEQSRTEDNLVECKTEHAKYLETFDTVHKCGYCEKVFRTVRMAMAHVFFHSDQFVCPYEGCMETYQRYGPLGQHLVRKHLPQGEGGSYVCGHCSADFDAYAKYRTHLRSECEYRQFACNFCEKRFFMQPHLDAHMEFHFNVRRFKCQYCDKRFTQSGDLRIHERIHTGDKPFKCPYCPKEFRSIGNRKDHVATHVASSKVKVSVLLCELFAVFLMILVFVVGLQCTECGTSFKSERILRGHMVIHSTEKRFKCELCPREFYRKYHLTKHMQTHPAEAYAEMFE